MSAGEALKAAIEAAAGGPLRGHLMADAPMASFTWFRTGGPADVLFLPADAADLAAGLAAIPAGVPVTVLGLASNTLVRDGGIEGVVIRLTAKAFAAISVEGREITAGAGAADVRVARAAAEAGLAGLSFLRGIPGAIGGALRMNAGAYGAETADRFVRAEALDRQGRPVRLSRDDMGFSYRRTAAPGDLIFTQATFAGTPGDRDAIQAEMDAITASREATQPVKSRTGGSTFKNPPGESAWKLIDRAGCRGLTIGAAQVSGLHCNFLLNTGGATAADIERLGETVRARVKETSGIDLHWEIRRIGRLPEGAAVSPLPRHQD